ncbi:MAG: hypothetical protein AB7K09_08880 [Planctomycetota bacterium]
MEALLLFAPAVVVMALLLVFAWKRHQQMHPKVLLPAIPADVRLGVQDETPEARAFMEQYREFIADFNRAGNPMQYRQLVDLLACGPRSLAALAAADLAASGMLGRYASDLELRNELGEIAAWNARRVAERSDLVSLFALLARLVELGGHNEDALDVWFGPQEADLRASDCPRRRALAVALLSRLGSPRQKQAAADAAAGETELQAELTAETSSAPLPPDVGEPLPTYAEAYHAE